MKKVTPASSALLHKTDLLTGCPCASTVAKNHGVGLGNPSLLSVSDPPPQQRQPAVGQPIDIEVGTAVLLLREILDSHVRQALVASLCPPGRLASALSDHRANATPFTSSSDPFLAVHLF